MPSAPARLRNRGVNRDHEIQGRYQRRRVVKIRQVPGPVDQVQSRRRRLSLFGGRALLKAEESDSPYTCQHGKLRQRNGAVAIIDMIGVPAPDQADVQFMLRGNFFQR